MYESGVTCSGRTPRSSTLSILPPPPFPLIAHGVHARTPTTKSKPATVRVEGRGMYLLPRFAHPCACVCVCLCARVVRQLRSFLPIFPLSLENFEKNMRILDSKMEIEEIERRTKERRRGWRTLAGGGFSRSRYRPTSDAPSYYYLPPLTWHCYEPPVRGSNEEREKDACGKSVLRDKS